MFILELTELAVNFDIDISPNTAAVQAAVQANLEDLLTREGGPGQTLYTSRISEAISLSSAEARHRLNIPAADTTAGQTEVHVLGTITFNSY